MVSCPADASVLTQVAIHLSHDLSLLCTCQCNYWTLSCAWGKWRVEYIREVAASRIARKSDRELLKHVGVQLDNIVSPLHCTLSLIPPTGLQLMEECRH